MDHRDAAISIGAVRPGTYHQGKCMATNYSRHPGNKRPYKFGRSRLPLQDRKEATDETSIEFSLFWSYPCLIRVYPSLFPSML